MVRFFLVALVAAPLLSFTANAFDMPSVRDSVGVARKNGKLFVQHKVEPKETLYALSRKYNVSVSQIVDANPTVETTIKIGEVVLIPRKATSNTSNAVASVAKTTAAAPVVSRTYTVSDAGNKMHTVVSGQTLFAISRLYNVSVDDIKKWNKLKDSNINLGSQLIVGKGDSKPTKKPVYLPEPDDVMTAKSTESESAGVSSNAIAKSEATPNERVVEKEEENTIVKRVVEGGLAEMIDSNGNSNKYLALHKTAPVGTIMQVKNQMNDQVVYVRVIGKLPDTGANEKTLVRISKKAYQKLGAVDQKFRVEVSYMP